jgi:replicative DNA helicase
VQLGEAYSGRTAHVKFVEGVESAVFNATRGIETVEEGVGLDVLVEREEERLREIEKGRVSSGGIPFGFGALDEKLGGGAPGETTIVAAARHGEERAARRTSR